MGTVLLGGSFCGGCAGIGGIRMTDPTDAFFLDTPFQTNEVSLAYIVSETGPAGDVFLTVGVLGEGIMASQKRGAASLRLAP